MSESKSVFMHPLLIIDEWRNGCSCTIDIASGKKGHPSLCQECTDGAMKAIEEWFEQNPQWKPAEPVSEELDALFYQAVEFIVAERKASISGIQRHLRIGYNRAARLVEQLQVKGIVSEPNENGNRQVL